MDETTGTAARPGARQVAVASLVVSALLVVVAISVLAEHGSVLAAVVAASASAVGFTLARRAWRARS